jgi:hypothetical protein
MPREMIMMAMTIVMFPRVSGWREHHRGGSNQKGRRLHCENSYFVVLDLSVFVSN